MLAVSLPLLALAQPQNTLNIQTNNFISASIKQQYPSIPDEDIETSIKYLPNNVLNKGCEEGLTLEWRSPLKAGSNAFIGRCLTPFWQAFGQLNLAVFKNVVVNRTPLNRKQPLSLNQLGTARMNIANLRMGYFENPATLVGYEVQRTLKSGQVITPYIVEAPSLVERGDWVTILSGKPGLTVSSTGEALKSGALGDQILVKNLKTNTRLKAWIIEKGVVSTRTSDL